MCRILQTTWRFLCGRRTRWQEHQAVDLEADYETKRRVMRRLMNRMGERGGKQGDQVKLQKGPWQ